MGSPVVRWQIISPDPGGAAEFYRKLFGWTVRTDDRSPSAHFEHTIVITDGAPVLLTA